MCGGVWRCEGGSRYGKIPCQTSPEQVQNSSEQCPNWVVSGLFDQGSGQVRQSFTKLSSSANSPARARTTRLQGQKFFCAELSRTFKFGRASSRTAHPPISDAAVHAVSTSAACSAPARRRPALLLHQPQRLLRRSLIPWTSVTHDACCGTYLLILPLVHHSSNPLDFPTFTSHPRMDL